MHWALLYLLALAARAVHLLAMKGEPLYRVPHGDGRGYVEWADRIRAEGLFASGEVFYQAPLYPHFLALLPRDPEVVRWVQALMGAGAAVLIGCATERMLRPNLGAEPIGRDPDWGEPDCSEPDERVRALARARRAGWVAGLLAALYGPSIWLDGLIQKSALVGLLVAGILFASTFATVRGRLALGGLIGLLALTRGEARLLAPAALLWILAQRRGAQVAALAGGLVLVLGPVLARNVAVGGEWVLTTSQAGPNLYIGNAPGSSGTYAPLVPGRGDVRYEAEDARRLAEDAEGRSLTRAEVSSHWTGRVVEESLGAPADALGRLMRKGLLAVSSMEVADTDDFYLAAKVSRVLRLAPGFGLLLCLAAAGLVLGDRRELRALGPALVLGVIQWGAVVLFFVLARYRLPLALALMPAAGLAGARLLEGTPHRQALQAAGAAALALVLSVAAQPRWLGILDPALGTAGALVNSGVTCLDAKPRDLAGAEAFAREALRLSPSSFDTRRLLARVLIERGGGDELEPALRAALELAPGDWQVRAWLGIALGEAGDLEEALSLLGPAALERPEATPVVVNASTLAGALGQEALALEIQRARLATLPNDEHALRFRLGIAGILNGASDGALRDPGGALAVLQGVQATGRLRALVADQRVRAHLALGDAGGALAELDQALSELPGGGAEAEALRGLRASVQSTRDPLGER